MGSGLMSGRMLDNMWGLGKIIKWTGKANSYGVMGGSIKGGIWMICNMGLGPLSGLMGEFIRGRGSAASSMGRGNIRMQRELSMIVSGWMGRGLIKNNKMDRPNYDFSSFFNSLEAIFLIFPYHFKNLAFMII